MQTLHKPTSTWLLHGWQREATTTSCDGFRWIVDLSPTLLRFNRGQSVVHLIQKVIGKTNTRGTDAGVVLPHGSWFNSTAPRLRRVAGRLSGRMRSKRSPSERPVKVWSSAVIDWPTTNWFFIHRSIRKSTVLNSRKRKVLDVQSNGLTWISKVIFALMIELLSHSLLDKASMLKSTGSSNPLQDSLL